MKKSKFDPTLNTNWMDVKKPDMNGYPSCCPHNIIRNKDVKLQDFLHYSDANIKERDVFGRKAAGLTYNYDDRLWGDKWEEGWKIASEMKNVVFKSARFFEIVLNHFHDVKNVNLQHVILGVNRSNGYSYLIFGYIYNKTQ